MSNDLVELGALWKAEDKNGTKYLSGKMGNARLLVFANKFKEEDKQPDFRVYVAAPKPKEDRDDAPDDDVPF